MNAKDRVGYFLLTLCALGFSALYVVVIDYVMEPQEPKSPCICECNEATDAD